MRTTIAVDDRLLTAARRLAKQRDQTLGHLVEDALRREIAAGRPAQAGVEVPVFRGSGGPRPGVDLRSNRAMRAALDDETPLRQLR